MDRTISDLQAQIDRLNLTLHQWRETQDHLVPLEQRLAQLSERCAEILNHWADTDHRHALAVTEVEARLTEWRDIEDRLERESLQRIREFERTIEQEWKALRQVHEEPVKHLREQAAALGETCVAAANLALRGFERAEARFALIEANLQGRLNQLSADLQAAIAELKREGGRQALGSAIEPFPLEGVMRIHDDLQQQAASVPAVQSPSVVDHPPAVIEPASSPRPGPDASARMESRMESIEREISSGREEAKETASMAERTRRDWRVAVALLVVIVGIIGFLMVRQRGLETRLADAADRVDAAERQTASATEAANAQIASIREEANRQIAQASDAAVKAQLLTGLLAAPNLLRFNLQGSNDVPNASAQVLFSRTSGVAVNVTRLPPPAQGSVYQLWLLTSATPAAAGVFTTDASGRGTLVDDTPANLPRVVGAMVTVEPAGGSPSPTGPIVLTRPVEP